jgi:hypothetical protein
MKFLLMIIDDEAAQSALPASEMAALIDSVRTIEHDLTARNKLLESRALRPSAEAVTVRRRGAEPFATDGPFAETKEFIGGYFLIDCDSKAEAIECAKRFPLVGTSAIEVRPIWELSAERDAKTRP